MEHEDVRTASPPKLTSVQENSSDCYDATYASMSIIRKDHVKEQRKQFEKDLESSVSSVEPKVPAFRNADSLKSKSFHAPNHFQNRKNDNSDLNFNLLPDDSKPLSPLNRSMGTRKSLSVKMEMQVNAFEKSGLNSESRLESPAKPGVHPKPTCMSIKTGMKSPNFDRSPLDRPANFPSLVPSSPALAPSSPLRGSYSPKNKYRNAFHNASQESTSQSNSPQQCPKNVPVIRTSPSPAPDAKLSNHENKGFASVGDCQANGVDHNSAKSPVVSEKNLNVVIPVNSVQGIAKSLSPPPKPPRLLSAIKQGPVPKPRKDLHAAKAKSGTYEHLTDAVSVVRTSEPKPNSHEVDCIEPSRSNDRIVSPAVKEPIKSPSRFPKDRSRIDQWWENKFIRAPKPTTRQTKESVQRIHNPSYMYAKTSRPDDIIAGQPLVRHHSEETLDSTPVFKMKGNISKAQYDDGPVYHSPVDVSCQKQKRLEKVMFDKDGYAVPSVMQDSAKNEISDFTQTRKVNDVTRNAQSIHEESSYVKSKVSSAYAVLRLPTFTESRAHAEQDEGDYDIDLEEHKRLLRYVSNVKYKTNEAVARYEKVRLASTNCLFQYAMIIGLCDDGCGNNIPKILFCFPREMMIGEKQTSSFCFPDADDLRPSTDYNGETFSFVLTSATGDRRYGLCKRYLPPGTGARLPEALYVVSAIGDSAFYGHLLDAVKESRFISRDCAEDLLQLAYAKPFPQPNHEVYLWMMGTNSKKKPLILKRMPDLRLPMADFSSLLSLLDVSTLIKVFSAILLERKIIFIAENLSTLSSCVCAAVSLLYPFEWQHTFVTILPSNLMEVVEAPTPYILGLLSSTVSNFADIINQLDEVLVLDLDSGRLLRNEGDEACIIPKKLQKALTVALSDDRDGQNMCLEQKGQSIQDATVAEAFLRLFVETCGHYTEYVCCQQDGEIVFQRELFVKAVHSRSIRLFLEWFTQTQMFSVFVTGRLKGETERGYFEERILEYRQEMEETTSTLENMKAIRKKIAGFFQKSGDRLRSAFQKAVYV